MSRPQDPPDAGKQGERERRQVATGVDPQGGTEAEREGERRKRPEWRLFSEMCPEKGDGMEDRKFSETGCQTRSRP